MKIFVTGKGFHALGEHFRAALKKPCQLKAGAQKDAVTVTRVLKAPPPPALLFSFITKAQRLPDVFFFLTRKHILEIWMQS